MSKLPPEEPKSISQGDRRSGADRRHDRDAHPDADRRTGEERRGADRRGDHETVRPSRELDFRALIEDWLDKNCQGDWRIGTNPRDPDDLTLRVHFDDPRDKARFNVALIKLAARMQKA